ncbi:DUF4360 domain-containing protein [Actinomadura sp. NEAU-AAG7]|uniref:DUF4360 domain-containing protein n=1 Tax=Actinomadura sp. NEAU-AAG7 TaxID=2839640 RepID=UPI001BE4625A|nr:DUF4360 domain-containing protein [Actinomadura sp. NEAU-AAG7]MBT2206761.1 DUF4360 domain-containing protein [Actinomadura sp. NEAU-AAG7]
MKFLDRRERVHKGMLVLGAVVAGLTAAATPAGAGSRPAHGPVGVTIVIAAANGSGCPPGTVRTQLDPDRDGFKVVYSQHMAQVGGSSSPADSRKNCQILLKVRVPDGYSYAISQVRSHGYAQLQDGANALHKGAFYFQGVLDGTRITHELKGAFRGSWRFTDTLPVLDWTRCGEEPDLILYTELRVDKGTSDPAKVSFISMDSTDQDAGTTYRLAWRTCP